MPFCDLVLDGSVANITTAAVLDGSVATVTPAAELDGSVATVTPAAVLDGSVVTIAPAAALDESVPTVNPAEALDGAMQNKQMPGNSLREKKRPRERIQEIELKKIKKAEEKHPMIVPMCRVRCRMKCSEKISDEQRTKIHATFWKMCYNARRCWISRLVKRKAVERHRIRTGPALFEEDNHARSFSNYYFLPKESDGIIEDTAVRQKCFLGTLGYTSNRVIFEMCKSMGAKGIIPAEDKRGPKGMLKKDRAVITRHILSFNPQISHYRREHAPNRRYLPGDLNIKFMYKDFKRCHPDFKCCYQTYRTVFAASNISFAEPDNDKCDDCAFYENQEDTEENRLLWDKHVTMARKARESYRSDEDKKWPDETAVFAADLQKVLLLPRLHDLKSCIFTSRLVVFNETFARMGKSEVDFDNLLVVWNESLAGRKKEDIASAYYAVIERMSDTKNFIFWLDNCSGQNKNWTLYSMFIRLVNRIPGPSPSEITLKYLAAGHTHLAADGIHGLIEKKLRKKKDVYDFRDLCDILQSSQTKNEIIEMKINDFYDLENDIVTRTKQNNLPILSDIVQVRFTRGDRRMHYKKNFDEDEIVVDVLKKAALKTLQNNDKITARSVMRGIFTAKKRKILKELASRMPENRRAFWRSLPESDASEDLLQKFE